MFKLWLKIHYYLSVFFLPLVLLYIVTGCFALLGFKSPPPILEADLVLDWSWEAEIKQRKLADFLHDHKLALPQGELKSYTNQLVWGEPSGFHLKVFYDQAKEKSTLNVYRPNLYYRLLAIHKNRGVNLHWFRGLVFIFCASYLGVYLSGFFMVFKNRKILKRSGLFIGAGFLVSLLLFCLSFY